jgi:hypothetical protein
VDISVKVTGDKEVIKKLDNLNPLIGSVLMARLGALAETLIKLRTAKGRDISGSIFDEYSKPYKLFRKQTGHKTNPPNLFYSGQMLGALTNTVESQNTVMVHFADAQQSKKASFNMKKRSFFGMSKQDISALRNELKSALYEKIR